MSSGLRGKLLSNDPFHSFYRLMTPPSCIFVGQEFGSHLYALWHLCSHAYSDQILEITPVHLLLGMACAPILVQALPIITCMTPSSPLKLDEARSHLAWDIGHRAAATTAETDSVGRSVLLVVYLLTPAAWGRWRECPLHSW